jgi:hypothetical protein
MLGIPGILLSLLPIPINTDAVSGRLHRADARSDLRSFVANSQSKFLLFSQPEWSLVGWKNLRKFCRQHFHDPPSSFSIAVHFPGGKNSETKLVKGALVLGHAVNSR